MKDFLVLFLIAGLICVGMAIFLRVGYLVYLLYLVLAGKKFEPYV